MTKRIARITIVAAAALSFALPATSANAEVICLIDDTTTGLRVCV